MFRRHLPSKSQYWHRQWRYLCRNLYQESQVIKDHPQTVWVQDNAQPEREVHEDAERNRRKEIALPLTRFGKQPYSMARRGGVVSVQLRWLRIDYLLSHQRTTRCYHNLFFYSPLALNNTVDAYLKLIWSNVNVQWRTNEKMCIISKATVGSSHMWSRVYDTEWATGSP